MPDGVIFNANRHLRHLLRKLSPVPPQALTERVLETMNSKRDKEKFDSKRSEPTLKNGGSGKSDYGAQSDLFAEKDAFLKRKSLDSEVRNSRRVPSPKHLGVLVVKPQLEDYYRLYIRQPGLELPDTIEQIVKVTMDSMTMALI